MAPFDPPVADTHAAFRGSLTARLALARRPDTARELLVLLAVDETEAVRRAVAGNTGAPPHADRLLAQDALASIRVSLARKLAGQASELARGMADGRTRLAWEVLLLLAQDLREEVRHALADTLADLPDAPHGLVLALARDTALLVSEPLIRLSASLTEEDLIGLVRNPPGPDSRVAVAWRLWLAERVCGVLVESGDTAALAALLRNPTARITFQNLSDLVNLTRSCPALLEPLASRAGLPSELAETLASIEEALSQTVLRGPSQPEVDEPSPRALPGNDKPAQAVRSLIWPTS